MVVNMENCERTISISVCVLSEARETLGSRWHHVSHRILSSLTVSRRICQTSSELLCDKMGLGPFSFDRTHRDIAICDPAARLHQCTCEPAVTLQPVTEQ